MKLGRRPIQTNLFDATLNDTLKHYTDAAWLGNNIPLATPYFLGRHLHKVKNPGTPAGLGRALQAVVGEAADSLWPGPLPQSQKGLLSAVADERADMGNDGPRYCFLLLDLRYLRRYFPPSAAPNQVNAMPDYLGVSKTRFFEHLKTARETLGLALLKLVQPGLRLEQPIPSGPIIGRDTLLRQCLSDLENGRSVTLIGTGGVGKTTLGSAIVQEWTAKQANPAVYWYTFRTGLNDNIESLIFTLAHFLSQLGCANLWLQLTANKGNMGRLEQSLGFLREDFNCAANQDILLCIDEVDLLYVQTEEARHAAYRQIIELLESLTPLASILHLGQRALIHTDAHYIVPPLTLPQTRKMLLQSQLPPTITAEQLHELAGGNPRMIELFLALYQSGEKFEDDPFQKSPAIEPVFSRLWKRLSGEEKEVLSTLSVFRSFAPADEWQNEAGFNLLKERNLLKFDAQGGVTLLPVFQNLVYEALPTQHRHYAHRQAAAVRDQYGRYTEAAYHLWMAKQHQVAVNMWFEHQDIEIAQGQTAAAYNIFCQNDPVELAGRSAKKYTLIQNRLNLLYGEAQAVLNRMNGFTWQSGERESADLMQQWGDALFASGDNEDALSRYEDAIHVLSDFSSRLIFLHHKRGQMFIEQAEANAVRREVQLAEFELERFKGLMEFMLGDFLKAKSHLETAKQFAQKLNDEARVAKSNQLLAIASGNYGDLLQAQGFAAEAMAYFQRVGDRLQLEGLRAELAGFYLNVGRFEEVIEPAEAALKFFENIQHSARIGYLCSNLAEAYYETGRLETAESYANRALQSGTPRVEPYVYYTLGLIKQTQKAFPEAEQYFQRGITQAELAEENFIAAYLYRAYGRMLLETNDPNQATANLIKALTLFAGLSMQHEVEKTQALLAV